MSNKKEKLNSKLKSNYSQKIKDYINRTESIKEILSSKLDNFCSFDLKLSQKNNNIKEKIKTSNNNGKKAIKEIKSKFLFSEKNDEKNSLSPKMKKLIRPLSSEILPGRVITLNKKNGFRNHIIIDINNFKKINFRQTNIRKCLSSGNNIKKKKVKLKIMEDFNIFKDKSPLDLLIEKKSLAYDQKIANNKFSNKNILKNFYKKNFKNDRDTISNKKYNYFLDKYFYVKSKLNTKQKEKKFKSTDKTLNFDNNKFKLFNNISKKLKQKIKLSSKKFDVKKILQKIKTEENIKNRARISRLKNDIEDEKILLTPRNFLKHKQDPFASYKVNKFIQVLNPDFTYRYRYILSKNFGIKLEKFLLKTEQSEKKNNKNKNES